MTGRIQCRYDLVVMAGLDPAIHVLASNKKDVDARVKPAHDAGRTSAHLRQPVRAAHSVWIASALRASQ
jgi:hypothetical protein